MVMNLVILAIVLASFALGFRIADIRAEVLDRLQRRRRAELVDPPATPRRAMTILPAQPAVARRPAARRPVALRTVARAAVSAASALHS